jgi:DNA replication and repair protein RecF
LRLERLIAHGFRNLDGVDLDTRSRFVVFSGRNAQGKTNTLEAIWLLATLKPLRARRSRELVGFGAAAASVIGDVEHGGARHRHKVAIDDGRRLAYLDDKPAELPGYFEDLRAIAFVPSDGGIVTGEPMRRRAWLDRAAFTASPAHLDVVRTWKRVHDQKAATLRAGRPDPLLLDALDDQLALAASRLVTRRRQVIADLGPHVERLHAAIAPRGGKLSIGYVSGITGDDADARLLSARHQLADARRREIERRMPLVGPQTDDVQLAIDGHAARAFGSQGQVRTAVLALKLAELLAARDRGDVPLFLIDDVGSELDRERKQQLVSVLHDTGAQVFATTTDPDHLRELPAVETAWYAVENGRLSRS